MGNMYWIARKKKQEDDVNIYYILGFDFSDETFKNICVCGGVGESRQIDVWVSNKLADGNVLFSKCLDYPVYCFGKHKSVIVWCQEEREEEGGNPYKCLTLYEFDELGLSKQIETQRDYVFGFAAFSFCGYVYVPSLVPLP
ncbi:hypothetical protein EUTSA_v10021952mg [Eutrema salsugineum]|uniref:F-box associated beta-propeller type 1 domain-containing protein n=1 Tax=Eutrema salsugineum TaxID=72664 RepID=V4NQY9_EUTSA|nr:hypothetical protein EUTSA_v10021952mg [Eutrema salsugineum]